MTWNEMIQNAGQEYDLKNIWYVWFLKLEDGRCYKKENGLTSAKLARQVWDEYYVPMNYEIEAWEIDVDWKEYPRFKLRVYVKKKEGDKE